MRFEFVIFKILIFLFYHLAAVMEEIMVKVTPQNAEAPTEPSRHRCYPDTYMIPARLSYFLVMAKDSCYQPYLILFFIGVGMSAREAAFINGIRLVGMVAGSIFWGHFTDTRHNHKRVVLFLCIVGMVLMALNPLLAIAVADKKRNVCPYPMDTIGDEKLKIEASFFVFLFLNTVASFFDGCILNFIDAGVIRRIETSTTPKDFGFNRLFGVFGYSIGSLISSLVINNFPATKANCYTGIFIMHFIFTFGLIFASQLLYKGEYMNIPAKDKATNVVKTAFRTFTELDNLMFILTVLVLGMMQAVFLSFTSLQLKNLNAPTIVLGLTTMIAAITMGPATMRSTKLISLFGSTWNVLIFGCFTYFVRYLLFAYITDPWLALPISIFQFFGLGLSSIATVHHIKEISSSQIYTTMFGVSNSLHFGFGYILANVIFGQIYKFYGGKTMFIVAGSSAAVWTFVLVVYKLVRRAFLSDDLVHKEKFNTTEEEAKKVHCESFISNY